MQVLYVDYGNSEVIDNTRLAALPVTVSTSVLAPQAKCYKLAAVTPAPAEWNDTTIAYVWMAVIDWWWLMMMMMMMMTLTGLPRRSS
jgi:hypothetical protein